MTRRESFQGLTQDIPLPMWLAGADGERLLFNQPWLTFTGRDLAEEEGSGWMEGIHPEDAARYREAFRTAVQTHQPFELEYRLRRVDGTYRWLVEMGIPRFRSDQTLAGFVGLCLDITERRAAQEALRLSRDQLAIILQGAADGVTALDRSGRLRYANEAAARMLGYPTPEALMAVSWEEVLARSEVRDEGDQPVPSDRMPSFLVMQGQPKASATVRLSSGQPGGERWLVMRSTPVFDELGRVELCVTLLHDITRLKQAEVSQRILAEAGRLLTSPLNGASSLADVVNLIVPSMADWCAADVVAPDGTLTRAAVACIDRARTAMFEGHPFELESPIGPARVIRTGAPEVFPFVPPSISQASSPLDLEAGRLRDRGLQSALVVPLVARGRVLGALSAVWAVTRRHYGEAELVLFEGLARRVALALDNARLFQEAQDLNATLEQRVQSRTGQLMAIRARLEDEVTERKEAQRRLEASRGQLRRLSAHLQQAREEERVRIAREIHDELGQALVGLKMDVAWLRRSLGRPAPGVLSKLEEMSGLIDETVHSVRRISAELRPSILDDLGLSAALEWQLEEFRARTGIDCVLTSRLGPKTLDPDRATALFRIFQEALTNVARHASASRVTVTIEETEDSLTLAIQDNGRGIRAEELGQPQSFGLLGMRERVHLLEGDIEIRGVPGEGTYVVVRIPARKLVRP
jgi:PAS domain S-box-containing protein